MIREERIKRGITGVAMAEHLGMDYRTYYRKERGERAWKLEEAIQLAQFLEMSVEDLFPQIKTA